MSGSILRTCVGCRRIRDRRDLVRFTLDASEGVTIDARRVSGRGAYLCPAVACFDKAWQRRALHRALRGPLATPEGRVVRERFVDAVKRRESSVGATREKDASREEGRGERKSHELFGRKGREGLIGAVVPPSGAAGGNEA